MRLLATMEKGPRTVSQLIQDTGLEQTAVSHNLKKLQSGSLVSSTAQGKYRVYELTQTAKQLLQALGAP